MPALPGTAASAPAPAVPRAPTLFRHPRAVREIDLGRAVVAYAFQRARRRSIGMVVSDEGLSVRAPRWVGWAEIEAALREKAAWIEAKLLEQHERARRHAAARIEWRDGATLPFLGETLTLRLDPRLTGARLERAAAAVAGAGAGPRSPECPHASEALERADARDAPHAPDATNGTNRTHGTNGTNATNGTNRTNGTNAPGAPGAPGRMLRLGLPPGAAPEQIRDAVQAWLKREARRVFEERCAHFAPRLGVRMRRLALSSAQTRWGSASADGSVRLNWRLIHFALPIVDYVVAHELAHLREMNHSPRFWDVVRSVIPDVDGARGVLRQETVPAFE